MYQSLYRKYRPHNFNDIVGQKSVIKILKNSILNNKISHAYMFSGPRGTGKTSVAKIFAKTVNCLNPKDGISCEKCENCLEINSNASVDIIEIDAASNNGVDEIRELKNNIKFSCSFLNYKVYIIDEVHMLSTGAFNALLKTLEEPPQHVIFILATTDPQKVPETIISRCQCFTFSQLSINDIFENLKNITKKEKISIDDKILLKIAEVSNGGMRDALVLLEKISLYGEKVTIKDFNEICGFVTDENIKSFIEQLDRGNIKEVVNIIDTNFMSGINLINFFNQVIDKMRVDIVEKIDNIDFVQKYVRYIKMLNELVNNIKNSTSSRNISIATIVKQIIDINCEKEDNKEIVSEETFIADDKVDNFEKLETDSSKNEIDENKVVINNDIIINNTFATASKQKLKEFKNNWKKLEEYILDRNIGSSVSFLLDSEICAVGDNNIILSFIYESLVDRAKGLYENLLEALNKILKENFYIAFVSQAEWLKLKEEYVKKIKEGYKYKVIDENPIIHKNTHTQAKQSLDSADLLFGKDIVEYE